jgi:hypothetical protein
MKCASHVVSILVLLGACDGGSAKPDSGYGDAAQDTDLGSAVGLDSGAASVTQDGAISTDSGVTVKALALGTYGGCVLTNQGKMICWGEDPRIAGSTIPSDPGPFISIVGATSNCVVLATDGTMRTFARPPQEPMPPLAGKWTQVATYENLCALAADGHVECSGRDKDLIAVTPSRSEWFSAISMGLGFACGIASSTDHSISCWGGNGQLEACVKANPAWDQLTPPSGGFKQISSGDITSCGIRLDDTVACWGIGVPGIAPTSDLCAAQDGGQALPPTGTFKQISVGFRTACGVKNDDTLVCWGMGKTDDGCNATGACGQAMPPSGTFTQVAVSFTHACAIRSNGKIACWGSKTGGRSLPPAELQ